MVDAPNSTDMRSPMDGVILFTPFNLHRRQFCQSTSEMIHISAVVEGKIEEAQRKIGCGYPRKLSFPSQFLSTTYHCWNMCLCDVISHIP